MNLVTQVVNYNNPSSLANQFRHKRFQVFDEKVKRIGQKQLRILDVGGTELFWKNRGYHLLPNIQITLLNIFEEKPSYTNFHAHVGDATNMIEFADKSFDIVFSNSVIEHLFKFENQKLMAKEVQRVSERHFIQTPNRYFFMEPHFLLPYFQFYPQSVKLWILTETKLSRGFKYSSEDAQRRIDEITLLSKNEMKELFPNSKFYDEKVLGMIKSFTAYNF